MRQVSEKVNFGDKDDESETGDVGMKVRWMMISRATDALSSSMRDDYDLWTRRRGLSNATLRSTAALRIISGSMAAWLRQQNDHGGASSKTASCVRPGLAIGIEHIP